MNLELMLGALREFEMDDVARQIETAVVNGYGPDYVDLQRVIRATVELLEDEGSRASLEDAVDAWRRRWKC